MAHVSQSAWFLGIDLGTGSCKSIVIDSRGKILGFGASGYSKIEVANQEEELNPEDLVWGMLRSVRSAIDNAGVSTNACQAISISGVYHSLIAIDKSGKPLTGVINWVGVQATKQAQAVRVIHDSSEIYQQTGCPVHGLYPLYKLIFIREEQPDIFKQAAHFISAKEYVIHRLTGEYLIDYGVAAGSALLNTHTLVWNSSSLELAGIRLDQLSPLVNPRQIIKCVNPELTSQMGIPKDTPIVIGSADAVNSSLGAGAVRSGQATCMIGTSGAFRIIAPYPLLDKQVRSFCYTIDQEHWLVGGAINNAGLSLTWLREAFNKILIGQMKDVPLSYDDLVAYAAQIPAGADGLICLPFFSGERSPYWNMNARGVFFGITLNHDARHMARALLEGVAYRLRSISDVLTALGIEVHEIRASGGFTRSDLWPQIVANVLGHDLLVPINGETSSLGAAFWAMLGSGVINNFEDLYPLVPINNTYLTSQQEASVYDSLYQIYLDLYFRLSESFDQISAYHPTDLEAK